MTEHADPGDSGRMVPLSFEQYLDRRQPVRDHWSRDHCDDCGATGQLLSRDGYCRACLQYQFGYDQAEQKMVMAMIGGAVTAALEAGATAEMIAFAFRRAMKGERDWHDTEAFSDFTYEDVLHSLEGRTP